MSQSHEHFMKQALREADKALEVDEVPIGAVVVMNDRIIGRGYNQVESLNDSTAHAEIIALSSAKWKKRKGMFMIVIEMPIAARFSALLTNRA